MSAFTPFNFYTFAAARGQFLRPDVRALLKAGRVSPFSNFANPDDRTLQRAAETLRRRLDDLLFPEGVPQPAERTSEVPLVDAPALCSSDVILKMA